MQGSERKSAYYSISRDSTVQGNQLHMCKPDLKSNGKLNNMTAAWVYVHKQVLLSYPLILKLAGGAPGSLSSSAKQVTSRKVKVCTDIYVSHKRTKQQNIFKFLNFMM